MASHWDDRHGYDEVDDRHSRRREGSPPSRGHEYDDDFRRSRSRSRDRYRRSGSRSRSPSSSRSPSRSPERWNHDRHGHETDSRLLRVWGIDKSSSDDKILLHMQMYGPAIKIKMLRNRGGPDSLNEAIVYFPTVADATSVLNLMGGPSALPLDGRQLKSAYFFERPYRRERPMDWICSTCKIQNFSRHDNCFNCHLPKLADAQLVPAEFTKRKNYESEEIPNSCLMVRQIPMDYVDGQLEALVVEHGLPPPKEVRVPRERGSGAVKGFGFIHFWDEPQATDFLARTARAPVLRGHQLRLLYATPERGGAPAPRRGMTAADYQRWQTLYSQPQETITASQVAGTQLKQTPPPNPPPGTQWFYDPQYGYYKDTNSGYYWDAASGYYFDRLSATYLVFDKTQMQFVSWDSESGKAVIAEQQQQPNQQDAQPAVQPAVQPTTAAQPQAVSEPKKKAKKIDPNLDRWNQKSKELREQDGREQLEKEEKETTKISFKLGGLAKPKQQSQPKPAPVSAAPVTEAANVFSQKGDNLPTPAAASTEQQNQHLPRDQTTPTPSIEITRGLVCLICKRQFPSEDKLDLHCRMSDLHKTNLEKLGIAPQLVADRDQDTSQNQYRNRAAERKAMYGDAEPLRNESKKRKPSPERDATVSSSSKVAKLADYHSINQPPPPLSADNNVGAKLMAKMGWSGGGLGRKETGMIDPIAATMRAAGAGLGAEGAQDVPLGVVPGASYADHVRLKARQRYEQMMSRPGM